MPHKPVKLARRNQETIKKLAYKSRSNNALVQKRENKPRNTNTPQSKLENKPRNNNSPAPRQEERARIVVTPPSPPGETSLSVETPPPPKPEEKHQKGRPTRTRDVIDETQPRCKVRVKPSGRGKGKEIDGRDDEENREISVEYSRERISKETFTSDTDYGLDSDFSSDVEGVDVVDKVGAATVGAVNAINTMAFGKGSVGQSSTVDSSTVFMDYSVDYAENKKKQKKKLPRQPKVVKKQLQKQPKPIKPSKAFIKATQTKKEVIKPKNGSHSSRSKSTVEKSGGAAVTFKDSKHVYFDEFGEPSVLRMGKVTPSAFLRNSVIVRVEASTVSITDCEMRRNINGNFVWPISLPMTPGQDLVGRIVHLGEKVQMYENFNVGDRVCSIHQFLGGNTRYATLMPNQLVRVPAGIEPPQAACIVRNYLAAYQILYRTGAFEIERGHRILVTGANGNIGRAVIDLAKAAKAHVFGAAGAHHARFVQYKLGAQYVNANPVNWSELKDIDIVVDCVNFTGNFNDSKEVLTKGGVLVCVGSAKYVSEAMSDQKKTLKQIDYDSDSDEGIQTMVTSKICGAFTQTSKKSSVYQSGCLKHLPLKCDPGVHLGVFVSKVRFRLFQNIENHWDACKDDLEYLFAKFLRGKINPQVNGCIPLNQVPKAHRRVESGGLQGTIICCPYMSVTTTKQSVHTGITGLKTK